MNFQQKVLESAVFIAGQAQQLADTAAAKVRDRVGRAGRNVDLNDTLEKLTAAGGELRKIARLHGARFVQDNATIARAAGKDLSDLGRSLYSGFTATKKPTARAARKRTSARRRSARKVA